MGISLAILVATSSVGALQSFFFGIYLFTLKKGRNIANLLLGVLLIVFSVRIIKSVSYYFSQGHIIPDLLMNFGFGCNLAILPVLWLYLNAFLNKEYRFSWKRDALHLLPTVVILILSPVLTDRFWLEQYGYFISLVAMLIYVPFCIHLVIKRFAALTHAQRLWVVSLVMGISLVWLSYLLNFVFRLVPYITGPVLFSFLTYFLSFVGLKVSALFTREAKYQATTHNPVHLEACFADLVKMIANTKPHIDPSLTLPRLASLLAVTPNLLSEAINTRAGLNFTDFINRHRIEEAQRMLEDPVHQHKKIATIAYETGFNSLSVFNTAFKKFTSMTPSVYRKAIPKR
jgi:AraC-like DNA-binding protein